jgi:hypothetical protein
MSDEERCRCAWFHCEVCGDHLPDSRGGSAFLKGCWYCWEHAPADAINRHQAITRGISLQDLLVEERNRGGQLIQVNRERVAVTNSNMPRAELIELAGPLGYDDADLWRVSPLGYPDALVTEDVVDVWNGVRFFTAPKRINASAVLNEGKT